jgi:hypothetical protein
MTKDRNQFRDDLPDDDGAGWINRFLAEEDEFDGRTMWRLASWGAGSVAALVVAILATRSPAAINRDQLASAELVRQSQQVQWIAKESQNKARELAAAVETLNADRDRLYTRVTVLEQGLDSVTGALARQPDPTTSTTAQPATPSAAAPPPAPSPPSAEADPIGPFRPAEARLTETKAEPPAALPKIAPVATIAPATPPAPAKPAEQKAETPGADQSPAPAVTAAISPPDPATSDLPSAGIVRRTEFGVDLGAAKSVEGLRAVWRGAIKTNAQHLASLQPIIVVKERNDGLGMQLRLVAGPLADAAEAAKICAGLLTENNRACETSVYEGQRLNLTSEKTVTEKEKAAAEEHPVQRPKRRSRSRAEAAEEKPRTSSFSSFFGVR